MPMSGERPQHRIGQRADSHLKSGTVLDQVSGEDADSLLLGGCSRVGPDFTENSPFKTGTSVPQIVVVVIFINAAP
ncbi:MAG: hypothetical protein H7222_15100 [Methylotenera sp.]|nr:hypothetical protein [Oligoflexia bacterium]